jgi:hypothetical protein
MVVCFSVLFLGITQTSTHFRLYLGDRFTFLTSNYLLINNICSSDRILIILHGFRSGGERNISFNSMAETTYQVSRKMKKVNDNAIQALLHRCALSYEKQYPFGGDTKFYKRFNFSMVPGYLVSVKYLPEINPLCSRIFVYRDNKIFSTHLTKW